MFVSKSSESMSHTHTSQQISHGVKKILIVSLSYLPQTGGAEIAIKEVTDRIADVEFHLIANRFDDAPREEKMGNVVVHRVGGGASYLSKMLFVPRAALAGARLHRTHRFDGAWAMMSYMVFPLLLMRVFGVRLPFAFTLQEGDSYEHVYGRLRIRAVRPLLRLAFRKASAASAISTFLAGWAKKVGYPRDVHVIPNGVDIGRFAAQYPKPVINEIKDALGKKMGDVFLITTSRLVPKNAVDDVIRALPKLPSNVHFIVLGTGSDEAALKKLAADVGVAERVQFLGQISHEEMPKYLKASDIFIRPSRSEGMGNSFVEAMAAGLPVIATQEGGISDFLFDEKRNPDKPITGWAVDKDSSDEIVAAVGDIIARPEKVRAVVATAKQMVIEKYDWDLIARTMREKVFAGVLGE